MASNDDYWPRTTSIQMALIRFISSSRAARKFTGKCSQRAQLSILGHSKATSRPFAENQFRGNELRYRGNARTHTHVYNVSTRSHSDAKGISNTETSGPRLVSYVTLPLDSASQKSPLSDIIPIVSETKHDSMLTSTASFI